jgi:hypothetical protein
MIEPIYLKEATQYKIPTDPDSDVSNPIKRAGKFSAVKTSYPYTTTMIPATSGQYPWWRANYQLKIGQSTAWKVKHVFVLNTSQTSYQTLLQGANVYIDSTLCEDLPTVTAASVWYRLTCKQSFTVQYRSGSYIKIRGKYSNALWIAGVKVFGYQS